MQNQSGRDSRVSMNENRNALDRIKFIILIRAGMVGPRINMTNGITSRLAARARDRNIHLEVGQ
jgi:hypothetical protein